MTVNLLVPWYGTPVADITLEGPNPLTGSVSLVVGNATFAMAVACGPDGVPRSATFAGQTYARLVGGAGGWRAPVTLAPLRNPAGILLSTALGDVAMAAVNPVTGKAETMGALPAGVDKSIGLFYVPQAGVPAGRLLAALAGPLWWMDPKGVTQVGAARTGPAIAAASAQVSHDDAGMGWVTVATEDVASWATPGATYASATVPMGITVRAARVRSDGGGDLRVEVLT
jgi:hypothetical protein